MATSLAAFGASEDYNPVQYSSVMREDRECANVSIGLRGFQRGSSRDV